MIKKLAVVLVTCVSLNVLLGSFPAPEKDNEWTYKTACLSSQNYPHDWYLVGSSRTRMGVNSALLGASMNESVYSLTCSSLFMPTSWGRLEALLRQVSHKKIILELSYNVSSLDYYPTLESKVQDLVSHINCFINSDLYSGSYFTQIIKSIFLSPLQFISSYSPSLEAAKFQDKFDQWGNTTDPVLGLSHNPIQKRSLRIRAEELESYFTIALVRGEENEYYLDGLQRLLDLAKQNDNQLYFYLPTTFNETEAEMFSQVWPYLPDENRLSPHKDPDFEKLLTKEYLFDEAHLNKDGSILLTKFLIRELIKKGNVTN